MAKEKGINAFHNNQDVCRSARDVIILAVKPNNIPEACSDLRKVPSEALVISIAAGITLEKLEEALPNRRVVRVMPNTPCLVGEAASAFASGKAVTQADKEVVGAIFGAVGLALEVDEKLLDAVTGLSGSGPAYVFQFIEALSDGGVRAGLPRSVAMQLAA